MSSVALSRLLRVGLAAFALSLTMPAMAADLAEPPPYAGPEGPPPEGPPPEEGGYERRGPSRVYREEQIDREVGPPRGGMPDYGPLRYSGGPRFMPPPDDGCRMIVRRDVDEYGEPIRRRMRVCDDQAGYDGMPPPRLRPSGYGGPPIPPADIPGGRYAPPPGY